VGTKKQRTREEIRRAILRIEHRRPKRIAKERCRMNISTVAREAGISAASIHNTYPDIADAIRARAGSALNVDPGRLDRKRLTELLRRARERLKAAEKDLVRIASENARLVTENSLLRARLSSRNVVDLVKGHPSREAARIPTR
jgi:AcrR family transcriptional regulator